MGANLHRGGLWGSESRHHGTALDLDPPTYWLRAYCPLYDANL